jgi:Na+-driven multidrug efflux pump
MGVICDTVANILFIVGMIVLIAFTNLGPVLIYGLVKLSDVAKTLIAYFWLKKEKWLVNLTIQPK